MAYSQSQARGRHGELGLNEVEFVLRDRAQHLALEDVFNSSSPRICGDDATTPS